MTLNLMPESDTPSATEMLYFQGAIYDHPKSDKFLLVSPSGRNLPYAAKEGKQGTLFHLTKHHSAQYKLERGSEVAIKVQDGEYHQTTQFPTQVRLSQQDIDALWRRYATLE